MSSKKLLDPTSNINAIFPATSTRQSDDNSNNATISERNNNNNNVRLVPVIPRTFAQTAFVNSVRPVSGAQMEEISRRVVRDVVGKLRKVMLEPLFTAKVTEAANTLCQGSVGGDSSARSVSRTNNNNDDDDDDEDEKLGESSPRAASPIDGSIRARRGDGGGGGIGNNNNNNRKNIYESSNNNNNINGEGGMNDDDDDEQRVRSPSENEENNLHNKKGNANNNNNNIIDEDDTGSKEKRRIENKKEMFLFLPSWNRDKKNNIIAEEQQRTPSNDLNEHKPIAITVTGTTTLDNQVGDGEAEHTKMLHQIRDNNITLIKTPRTQTPGILNIVEAKILFAKNFCNNNAEENNVFSQQQHEQMITNNNDNNHNNSDKNMSNLQALCLSPTSTSATTRERRVSIQVPDIVVAREKNNKKNRNTSNNDDENTDGNSSQTKIVGADTAGVGAPMMMAMFVPTELCGVVGPAVARSNNNNNTQSNNNNDSFTNVHHKGSSSFRHSDTKNNNYNNNHNNSMSLTNSNERMILTTVPFTNVSVKKTVFGNNRHDHDNSNSSCRNLIDKGKNKETNDNDNSEQHQEQQQEKQMSLMPFLESRSLYFGLIPRRELLLQIFFGGICGSDPRRGKNKNEKNPTPASSPPISTMSSLLKRLLILTNENDNNNSQDETTKNTRNLYFNLLHQKLLQILFNIIITATTSTATPPPPIASNSNYNNFNVHSNNNNNNNNNNASNHHNAATVMMMMEVFHEILSVFYKIGHHGNGRSDSQYQHQGQQLQQHQSREDNIMSPGSLRDNSFVASNRYHSTNNNSGAFNQKTTPSASPVAVISLPGLPLKALTPTYSPSAFLFANNNHNNSNINSPTSLSQQQLQKKVVVDLFFSALVRLHGTEELMKGVRRQQQQQHLLQLLKSSYVQSPLTTITTSTRTAIAHGFTTIPAKSNNCNNNNANINNMINQDGSSNYIINNNNANKNNNNNNNNMNALQQQQQQLSIDNNSNNIIPNHFLFRKNLPAGMTSTSQPPQQQPQQAEEADNKPKSDINNQMHYNLLFGDSMGFSAGVGDENSNINNNTNNGAGGDAAVAGTPSCAITQQQHVTFSIKSLIGLSAKWASTINKYRDGHHDEDNNDMTFQSLLLGNDDELQENVEGDEGRRKNNNKKQKITNIQLSKPNNATTLELEDPLLAAIAETGSPSLVTSFLDASPTIFDDSYSSSCGRYPGTFKPVVQIGKGAFGTAYLVVYKENIQKIEEQKRNSSGRRNKNKKTMIVMNQSGNSNMNYSTSQQQQQQQQQQLMHASSNRYGASAASQKDGSNASATGLIGLSTAIEGPLATSVVPNRSFTSNKTNIINNTNKNMIVSSSAHPQPLTIVPPGGIQTSNLNANSNAFGSMYYQSPQSMRSASNVNNNNNNSSGRKDFDTSSSPIDNFLHRRNRRLLPVGGPAGGVCGSAATTPLIVLNVKDKVTGRTIPTQVRREDIFVCKVEQLPDPKQVEKDGKERAKKERPEYDSDFDDKEDEKDAKAKNEQQQNKSDRKSDFAVEETKKRLERMQNEADILSNIAHPNIVGFIDYFFDKKANQQLLFLEYVDGGDLFKEMEKRSKTTPRRYFSIDSVMQIFVQTVLAVEYLHRHNILHRDIKSQNILVSKHYFVKLTDFGTSRQFDEDVDQDVESGLFGTPYYLSVELVTGRQYSQKSEIWALGVLLYELLTFDYPFGGNSLQELCSNIATTPPRKLKRPGAQIPTEIVQLLSRLLQKDPHNRPTARQILTDFNVAKDALQYYRHRFTQFVRSNHATKADQAWFGVLDEHVRTVLEEDRRVSSQRSRAESSFVRGSVARERSHLNLPNAPVMAISMSRMSARGGGESICSSQGGFGRNNQSDASRRPLVGEGSSLRRNYHYGVSGVGVGGTSNQNTVMSSVRGTRNNHNTNDSKQTQKPVSHQQKGVVMAKRRMINNYSDDEEDE